MTTDEKDGAKREPLRRASAVGLGLIGFSGVLFAAIFAVPLLPLSGPGKITMGVGLYVAVQIAWWVGAALAGREVLSRTKTWFGQRFQFWNASNE